MSGHSVGKVSKASCKKRETLVDVVVAVEVVVVVVVVVDEELPPLLSLLSYIPFCILSNVSLYFDERYSINAASCKILFKSCF